MAAKLYQFRYYGNDTEYNQPSDLKKDDLINGTAFNAYYPITQIGIQAKPGTVFRLNSGLYDIMVGSTGIYELDFPVGTQLTSLAFDEKNFEASNWQDGDYIIIDIAYGG